MKLRLKAIGSSLLITLSFVLGIGILSSAAMTAFKSSAEHVTLISGAAQAAYLLLVLLLLRIKKIDWRLFAFRRSPIYSRPSRRFLPNLPAECQKTWKQA